MTDDEKPDAAAPLPVPGAFAYNVADVAQLTRTSVRFVQKAVKEGDLRPCYPHSDARFTPAAVADWVTGWESTPPTR